MPWVPRFRHAETEGVVEQGENRLIPPQIDPMVTPGSNHGFAAVRCFT